MENSFSLPYYFSFLFYRTSILFPWVEYKTTYVFILVGKSTEKSHERTKQHHYYNTLQDESSVPGKPQKGKQSSTATVGSRRQEMLVKLREEALLGRNSQESLEGGEEDIF